MGEGPVAKKKRKRSDTTSRRQKPRKLQRTTPIDVGKIIAPPSRDASKAKSNEAFRATRLDNLIWKEVQIPDVLDDYEGFYGLEEVDDVDVVRQGNIVSYKAKQERDSQDKRVEGWGLNEDAEFEDGTRESGDEELIEQEENNGDEWEGFSDEDAITPSETLAKGAEQKQEKQLAKLAGDHQVNKVNEARPQAKKAPTTKQDSIMRTNDPAIEVDKAELAGPAAQSLDDELSTNGFAGLSDEDLDDNSADNSKWLSLPINPQIRAALGKMNFNNPTPIQKAVIPDIIDGHDVVGKAATGSGKTLAYGIPILDAFLSEETSGEAKLEEDHIPTALILAPTRELAIQINTHLAALHDQLEGRRPRLATVTGGLAVQKQQRLLSKADIIVATPGRLWDVVSSSSGLMTRLKQARFIVIDEADRLLSEGHFKEVDEILTALNRTIDDQVNEQVEEDDEDAKKAAELHHRQTLVFSATFSKDLQQKLANRKKRHQIDSKSSMDMSTDESLWYLLARLPFQPGQKPKFIDVNPISAIAPNLREALVECPTPLEKDLYLYTLLLLHPRTRTLVFANSISAVRRLVPFLQNLGLPAQALHSNMQQKARLRAVERFATDSYRIPQQQAQSAKQGKTASVGDVRNETGILICTDIASRGLDIPGVELVVHYHLPRTADTYIHRSGRTARAGAKGGSVLLCAPTEVLNMRRLVGRIHADHGGEDAEEEGSTKQKKPRRALRILDLDHRVVSRVKDRAKLAKKIADVEAARMTKGTTAKVPDIEEAELEHNEDEKPEPKQNGRTSHRDVLRQAALDLGVDYETDSDDPTTRIKARGVRGNARRAKTKTDAVVSKAEVASWKAQLRDLLSKRVNVGVSERYITGGNVDIDGLLNGGGLWVGDVNAVDLDLEGL